MTMNAVKNSIPAEIHVIFRGPVWAGLGSDSVAAAALAADDLRPCEASGKCWSASEEWGERTGKVRPSKRIITICEQGGEFHPCKNDMDIGAFLGSSPHEGAFNWNRHQWTWTAKEWEYLHALLVLRGEMD